MAVLIEGMKIPKFLFVTMAQFSKQVKAIGLTAQTTTHLMLEKCQSYTKPLKFWQILKQEFFIVF